jgi:hypothetical protein
MRVMHRSVLLLNNHHPRQVWTLTNMQPMQSPCPSSLSADCRSSSQSSRPGGRRDWTFLVRHVPTVTEPERHATLATRNAWLCRAPPGRPMPRLAAVTTGRQRPHGSPLVGPSARAEDVSQADSEPIRPHIGAAWFDSNAESNTASTRTAGATGHRVAAPPTDAVGRRQTACPDLRIGGSTGDTGRQHVAISGRHELLSICPPIRPVPPPTARAM